MPNQINLIMQSISIFYFFSTGSALLAAMPLGARTMFSSSSRVAGPPGPVCSPVGGWFLMGLKSTTRSSLTAKTVSVASQGSSLG